jgi:hypothetical protein
MTDENIFYVFVNLRSIDELPEFYVVPSKIVAKFTSTNHKNWLSEKGKKGQQRNDSTMRKFRDIEKEYLNRWDLLNL